MTTPEPFPSRWRRRSRTIPIMLLATMLGLLLSPVIILAAAARDLARGHRRLPTVRVFLFLLQYGTNDSLEILLVPMYWCVAGFGRLIDGPASIARHRRLQRWSIDVLARRADRLLGLRPAFEPDAAGVLLPVPVLVLCRHVNLVDASLPTLLYQRLGVDSRGVIMAELLADPGFDLLYPRTGSVFVPRDNAPEAIDAVRGLGQSSDHSTATVIFPEGRLFRPEVLRRALGRLAADNPDRAARLEPLTHTLPPRPGGVLALLDAMESDVVVIAHSGLDRFATFRELAAAVPLSDPIRVTAWRVPYGEIPPGAAERIAWLDEQWLRIDRWVDDQLT